MYAIPTDIILRKLVPPDIGRLVHYLDRLSPETKKRFGPHAYHADAVIQFYAPGDVTGFIALESRTDSIIAYSIIKKGMLNHDSNRLKSYPYPDIEDNCCTYAPSVADEWQGKGIGQLLFDHILQDCRKKSIKKIILWGGVQSTNEKALRFYTKLGFLTLGQFEYNGLNQDMLLEI